MADDLIQQIGEENSALRALATQAILQGLAEQNKYSAEELEGVVDYAINYGAILTALAVKVAKVSAQKGLTAPLNFLSELYIGEQFTSVQIPVEVLGGDSTWKEATVKALGGFVASIIAEKIAAGALSRLTATGSGATATATGIIGTVAVCYFAANIVSDFIGDQWDHYVGPKIEGSWNVAYNSAEFTIFGKLSDALRNKWDSMDAGADSQAINLNLNNLSEWTIRSAHPQQEQLELTYVRSTNTYSFLNASTDYIVYSLRDIEQSRADRVNLTQEIVKHHEGDFNVVIDSTAPHLVHNFYGLSRDELQQLVATGQNLQALWAAQNLTAFVEEVMDDYQSINPTDYSEQYLKDRATFLYHFLHSGMESPTSEDIDFEDLALEKSAYAGNGEINLPGNAQYLFGATGSDSIFGSWFADRADHLYGMEGNDVLVGGGGDDYLEGGKGQDSMDGGTGSDTFFVMGTDESYDEFHGGEGTDTILGGAGDDTIRVHELLVSDSIEIIDGGGGNNQIKGTEIGDTIDFSSAQLMKIAEIHGEDGADTITGTVDNDHIYGDSGADTLKGGDGEDWLYGGDGMDTLIGGADNDTLIGGEGIDTYIINSGDGDDAIIDEGRNILVINGEIFAGVFVKEDGASSYTFTSDDGTVITTYTMTFNLHGTLTIDDSTSIAFNNQISPTDFSMFDFGISLQETPDDEFDLNIIGTSWTDSLIGDYVFDDDGNRRDYYHLDSWNDSNQNFIIDNDEERIGDDEHSGDIRFKTIYFDGGSGNDLIVGERGYDCLLGGYGDDTLVGQGCWLYSDPTHPDAGNYMDGEVGNDLLLGGVGVDTMFGGEGNDILSGVFGRDTLTGQDGDDVLAGGNDSDFLEGGAGQDVLFGDRVVYTHSADTGWAHDFAITFTYYANGCISSYTTTNFYTSSNEARVPVEDLTPGNDVLDGGAGKDLLYGDYGNDLLLGGTGQDTLIGGEGDDLLYGEADGDLLFGDDGFNPGEGNDILYGEAGADQLQGGGGNDVLYGGDDNDVLFGEEGDDQLYGGGGDDVLFGDNSDHAADGNDVLYGGDGDDHLEGGGGNDSLYGDAGVDALIGQDGNDVLYGGEGNDTILGDNSDNSGSGSDALYGGGGNDDLVGAGGDDTLYGDDGDDNLWGEADSDALYGGIGNDHLQGGDGNDLLDGGEGVDALYGQAGDDTLFGGAGDDWLAGEDEENSAVVSSLTGNDTLFGGTGNDFLIGGNGNDTLSGDEGDDCLYGGAGNDTLNGGEGNDLLWSGTGADSLNGGAGDDIYYISRGSGIKHITDGSGYNRVVFLNGINLSMISLSLGSLMFSSGDVGDELHLDGVDYNDLAGTSPIDMIEFSDGQTMTVAEVIAVKGINLPATDEADVIIGTSGRDNINALSGNDMVDGRGGNDIIDLGAGNDTAQAGEGSDIVIAGDGDDVVYGDADNDTINGGAGLDTLYGGADNDTLYGDAGDDILFGGEGIDQLNGGVGFDILNGDSGDDILHGNDDNDHLFGGADNDTLYGDAGDDVLEGEDGDDQLYGDAGNDTLYGGAGNDVLTGGAGTDTLAGGFGDDTYMVDSTDDTLIENAGEGLDMVIASLNSSLVANIENLRLAEGTSILTGTGNELNNAIEGNAQNNSLYGMAGTDTLIGNGGNDLLDGGSGADVLIGGAGDDQYLVDDTADSIIETTGNGTDTVTATINYTLAGNVENLVLVGAQSQNGTGNSLSNTLMGNERNNLLDGQAGNDILNGGAGDDRLIGGTGSDRMVGGMGNDIYEVDNAGDVVVESANEGIDLVESSVSATLAAHVENLSLTGTAAINATGNTDNNLLQGNSGNNTLSGLEGNDELRGGDGDDRLIGGAGTDQLFGGIGNDTYVIESLEDTLIENAGEGTDTVESSVTSTLGDNFENLTLTGTAAINGYGNETNNRLVGNSGDNLLDGGLGADTLEGGMGDDTYLTENAGDTLIEAIGQGIDTEIRSFSTLQALADNVENLTLAGTVSSGSGNNLDNIITGNTTNNLLLGLDGDDTLIGGLGSDQMEGGSGNDTYVVDDAGDVVVELADEGYDTVESNLSIVLGANLENAALTGSAHINATGNDLDNQLQGNSGNNLLDGGAGSDSMAGGAGNDTYLTETEGDSIYEEADQGVDTEIRNYETLYLLTNNVENLTLMGDVYRGNGNELDNIITGNDADNNLWGREGNDTLIGNGGDDALFGAEGQDTLIGGTGDDYYEIDDVGDTIIEGENAGDDFVRSTVSFTLGANVERLAVDGYEDLSVTGNMLSNGLWGNEGNNLLTGGQGNDYLEGGLGNDTYIFNRGDGQDSIEDYDLAEGGDVLQFGAGITENDVLAFQYGDNIFFKIKGSDDQIGFIDYYAADSDVDGVTYDHKVNSVEFANNVVWDQAMIQTVVDRANNNHAPTVSSYLPTLQARAGSLFSYVVPVSTITDPDVWDSITYSVKMPDGSALPDWLTFDATTRTLSGTPDTGDVGSLQFILWGTDNYNYSAGEYVTMNIAVPNRAPVLSAALVDKTAALGGVFSYTFTSTTFTDPDTGDTLSYTATLADGSALPTWLSFNAATRTFSGTPSTIGTVSVLVTARDTANLAATDIFDITVSVQDLTLTGTSSADTLNGAAGNDTLSGLAGNDTLNGYAGNDTLNGGTGNDTMLGGLGNDTYVVDATGDVVTENAGEGSDTVQSSVTYTLTANVENLTLTGSTTLNGTGNTLDNILTGNSGANTLTGGAGNDTLIGGAGTDIMLGGAGNDTYVVDATTDVVTENASEGTDTVQSSVTYTLGSNVENLTLTGSTALNGTGNALDNILIGNSAANTLTGGAGNDTMLGGLGNDIYVVDATGDVVTENAGEGSDTVQSSATYVLSANVENLTLTGSTALNGTGNILDNILTGNSAANTLAGGDGNDTLTGGAGNDTMLGGLGNDTYVIDATGDVVTENAGEGSDTVQSSVTYTLSANVENLTLTGSTALNGTGNTLDNILTGNSGANTLTGGAGNDTLIGGAGTDTMLGGAGNDIYVVDVTTDVVTENAGEGTDTIQSGVTYTLGANVENLTLTGSSAVNGTGNTLDNIIIGNTGANTLSGGTGNDVLIGGLGNDTLTGGAGNDIFLFDTAPNATTNKDSLSDFVAGQDIIKLDKDVFAALTVEGTLSAANFKSSTTGVAGDANDYILYNTTSGALLYDADGNGSGAAVQFATLTTKPAITASDCMVAA